MINIYPLFSLSDRHRQTMQPQQPSSAIAGIPFQTENSGNARKPTGFQGFIFRHFENFPSKDLEFHPSPHTFATVIRQQSQMQNPIGTHCARSVDRQKTEARIYALSTVINHHQKRSNEYGDNKTDFSSHDQMNTTTPRPLKTDYKEL